MDAAGRFRTFAEECERKAVATADGEDEAFWYLIAAQWRICAERAEERRAGKMARRVS